MDTTQPRTRTRTRRLTGAVASATAVAFLGATVIAPASAQAAGIATGHRLPAPPPVALADPASPTTSVVGGRVLTYRVAGGRLERT